MFKLIIQDDEGKTTVVPLIRDEISIGRKEGNTIRLTERNVSRKHARIVRDDEQILLEDLESYNGVRVNGQRIAGKAEIRESDRIQIGDYLLEIRRERAASRDPFGEQATDPVPRAEAVGALADAGDARPKNGGPAGHAAAATTPLAARPTSVPGVPALDTAMIESADTMPGVGLKPVEAPVGASRLVVMSANFAGREFPLDKPSVVIGRTDDNDVVIDHRSISRHHAKVVREKDRYAIVDLQSSNGVRVNGEEYGKVELRRGDLIDLGHVRFRFVEAGEDFVFERDGTVVDLSAGRGRSTGKMIGAFVLLGAAVAAVVLILARRPDGGGAVAQPVGTPDAGAAVEPSVPMVVPGTDAAVPANALERYIADARTAVQAERWNDALASTQQALAIDPENEQAGRLAEQARRELKNQSLYSEFQAAARRGDVEGMSARLDQLPEDSVYHARATPQFEDAKSTWLRDQIAVVEDLAAEGNCKEVDRAIKKAVKTMPSSQEALQGIGARCEEKVVERVPDKKPPREGPVSPPDGGTTPPPRPAEGDFDGLFEEARKAFAANQDAKALTKAEAALDIRPGDQNALSIAAYAACRLKRGEVAKRYYERLRGQRQQNVKAGCAQTGVFFP